MAGLKFGFGISGYVGLGEELSLADYGTKWDMTVEIINPLSTETTYTKENNKTNLKIYVNGTSSWATGTIIPFTTTGYIYLGSLSSWTSRYRIKLRGLNGYKFYCPTQGNTTLFKLALTETGNSSKSNVPLDTVRSLNVSTLFATYPTLGNNDKLSELEFVTLSFNGSDITSRWINFLNDIISGNWNSINLVALDIGLVYEQPTPTGFTGEFNGVNMTCNPTPESGYEDGEQVTFELSENIGFKCFESPYLLMNGVETPFEYVNNKWTLTFNVTADFSIEGEAKRALTVVYDTVRGCDLNLANGQVIDVSEIDALNPLVIQATVRNNYYFNPQSDNANASIGDTDYDFSYSGGTIDYAPLAILRIYTIPSGESLVFDIEAFYTYDKLGIISIYSPTNAEMRQLAGKRFYNIQAQSFEDYSNYIVSIHKLYLNPSVINYDLQSVKYGNFDTGVDCKLILDTIITLDFGTITINEYHHNSLDYSNTIIKAYLPFIGFVNLKTLDYMGYTVSLKYNVNPMNGDCVAIFMIDEIIIDTFTGNVGFKIPIRFNETNSSRNEYSDNSLYLVNNLTPYVELTTQKIYEPSIDLFGHDDNRQGLISSFSGWCVFSDIDLDMCDMTKTEYDEILSILKSGVIL